MDKLYNIVLLLLKIIVLAMLIIVNYRMLILKDTLTTNDIFWCLSALIFVCYMDIMNKLEK